MKMLSSVGALVLAFALSVSIFAEDAPFDSRLDPVRQAIEKSDFASAEALGRRLLDTWRKGGAPSPDDEAELYRLLAKSMWEGGRGAEPEALEFAGKGVEIGRAHLAQDDELMGTLLLDLACVYSARGELDLEESALTEGCNIYIRSGSTQLSNCYNNLGNFYRTRGETAKAVDYLQRSIDLETSRRGRDSLDVAGRLSNLGNALSDMGKSTEARAAFDESLRIHERLLGKEDPELFNILNNSGYQDFMDGFYQDSEQKFRRALAICEKSGESCGSVYVNLGILLQNIGDPEGNEFLDKAVASYREAKGPQSLEYAMALGNRCVGRPDWDSARKLSEASEAHRIFLRELGPNDPHTGWTSILMIDPLIEIADLDRAQAQAYEALSVLRAGNGGGPRGMEAIALQGLARIAVLRKDAAGAESMLNESLEAAVDRAGSDSDTAADALKKRADFFIDQRRYNEALTDLGEAEDILSHLPTNQAWKLGEVYRLKARVYQARSRWDRAEENLRKALAVLEVKGAPDRPREAKIDLQLADVLADADRVVDAIRQALQAERIARNHLRLTVGGLDETRALAAAAQRVRGLDAALGWLKEDSPPDLIADVYDQLIRSRALVYEEMLSRSHILQTNSDKELGGLAQDLARVRGQLSNLLLRDLGDLPQNASSLIDRLNHEKQHLEKEIGRRSAAFAAEQRAQAVGLKEIQSALNPEIALLSYVRYSPHTNGPEAYAGFLLTKQRIEFRQLGSADEIDHVVRRWREVVSTREAGWRESARSLASRVLAPWARNLRIEKLLIVPDGSLDLVNFSALVRPDGRLWLESGPLIHYLNAERELASLGRNIPETMGLVVVGAPDFDLGAAESDKPPASRTRSSCESMRGSHFAPLNGARREGEQIVELWPSEQLGRPTLLEGDEATESAFRARAPGSRVLHLATHGFFLNGECPAFSLRARGVGGLLGMDSQGRVRIADPLALSGLALAGANERGWVADGRDDGILTAEEVAGLDLNGTEWAVLSACDTGEGELENGEGVLGLRRAFAVAGVRTTIMSLWSVDDEHTRGWMTTLYRKRFNEGRSTAEAIREADLALFASGHDPADWAAFIGVGDWR